VKALALVVQEEEEGETEGDIERCCLCATEERDEGSAKARRYPGAVRTSELSF
jgi:hypothetical protein